MPEQSVSISQQLLPDITVVFFMSLIRWFVSLCELWLQLNCYFLFTFWRDEVTSCLQ